MADEFVPPNLTRREFLGWAAASALAGASWLSACGRSGARTVRFLNWSGNMGEDTLQRFERETGVLVNCDYYTTAAGILAKLSGKAGAYDLVIAPDHVVPRLRELKRLRPIPHHELKSLPGIAAFLRNPPYDPGLGYTVPYLWGTMGLGVSAPRFHRRPDSWWALWDEKYKGRLSMLDDPHKTIQCALLMLGLPAGSKDPAHLKKARDLLLRQRPLVQEYDSANYPEKLAAGRLWLSQAWSGDVLQAVAEGKKVDFIVPKEGSFFWTDSLCLPRGSQHKKEAMLLLDYLLRPDVAAEIANATRSAPADEAALPLLDLSLRKDPRAFPPPAVLSRLRFAPALDAKTEDLWHRTWEEVQG
jgi:spermidine/putrescine transport system substrate-binding protein